MIDEGLVKELISNELKDEEFLVELTLSGSNHIQVVIDSDTSITIDRCVAISRAIEQELDRDQEDFSMDVCSAGLSSPLKKVRQYHKNIGRDFDVVQADGTKFQGKLIGATDTNVEFEVEELIKPEGKKRKELVVKQITLPYNQIKTAIIVVSFR